MKFFNIIPTVAAILASSSIVSAHHMITNMIINGVDQGLGKCLRIPPTTSPVTNINSDDMACNVGGLTPVARSCEIDAGSSLTFIWRSWPDGSVPGSLDASHQGPCAVYLRKVSDINTSNAAGGGWFKIFEDGYRDGKFCSQRIIDSGGRMTVTIPRDIPGGAYLIRGEQLALHQAQDLGGAQWYIGCGQLVISSTGGDFYPGWVRIPGHVKADDPGVLYNYWVPKRPHSEYVIPGPPVHIPVGGGTRPVEHRTEPGNWSDCVATNANWCGKPVPSFTDEASCYRASQVCWTQLDACYRSAPATGSAGCHSYESVCSRYQRQCQTCGAARNCRGSFT
ncbi:family 61 glycoside hydrolase [Peziza echinospora]|nr:family 61 glycoside hydrolase [Peziza echinospora]